MTLADDVRAVAELRRKAVASTSRFTLPWDQFTVAAAFDLDWDALTAAVERDDATLTDEQRADRKWRDAHPEQP